MSINDNSLEALLEEIELAQKEFRSPDVSVAFAFYLMINEVIKLNKIINVLLDYHPKIKDDPRLKDFISNK